MCQSTCHLHQHKIQLQCIILPAALQSTSMHAYTHVSNLRFSGRQPLAGQAWPLQGMRNDYVIKKGSVLLPYFVLFLDDVLIYFRVVFCERWGIIIAAHWSPKAPAITHLPPWLQVLVVGDRQQLKQVQEINVHVCIQSVYSKTTCGFM
jgi:hypothetical protein